MQDVLKTAIKSLAKSAQEATKSDDAMKYAQAAQNLTHALLASASLQQQEELDRIRQPMGA